MNRRLLLMWAGAAGVVALGSTAALRLEAPVSLAQEGVSDPAATPDDAMRIADLQTRVADLTTRVAQLGGADPAALEGRLGGSRSGFDARFGSPVAYLGPNLLQYLSPDLGRVTVTFENGMAQEITAMSPRPYTLAMTEPDAADWTAARASAIAAELAPADADIPSPAADASSSSTGSSEALRQAGGAAETGACLPAGPRGFAVMFTAPDSDHIAAVTLSADPAGEPATPPKPERAGRSTRGASAVANSSMGGTVSVNGLRMQAVDIAESAPRAVAGGAFTEFSVEVVIDNQTRKPVRFDPTDFVLVDAAGYELTAGCQGPAPSLAQAEAPKGQQIDGWVTFLVPEGFVPQKLVILAGNARVGFSLR